MSDFRKWAIALLLGSACIIISYFWVDRATAYFVHDRLRDYRAFFDVAALLPKAVGPLAIGLTVIFGIAALMRQRLSKFQSAIVLSALSLAVSDILENWLKFIFGRTWPETWVGGNPSLIRDGVHGFNPFHGGPGFAAFPSGHMTAICSMVSVFWICYPRFRVFYAVCVGTVIIGQLGANYHFVSDLMAGGLLGVSVGWMITALWMRGLARQ